MQASDLAHEIARRRTFAIISHPDAGKTTLTEKLLLYAGAVHLAGAVRARKSQRRATSDWMALEQERGISITTTALQFEHAGHVLNLLDTPGHQDFSEDTYRTLTAVDSAVMVLDSAKGIEPQTLKLFEVCRARGIPILTFVNKLDHVGREPLDLLDEIERVLGLAAVPMNWPIGQGPDFQGVYDIGAQRVLRFERTEHNERRVPVVALPLDDPRLPDEIGAGPARALRDDIALLAAAGAAFDRDAFLGGKVTPVFFGSALNNFGVEPFLAALLALAPPPTARRSDRGPIDPASERFSGFVFKIQANLDPQHRDCMAFVRICSGRFRREMIVRHARLGRKVRLTRPHRLFARERETVEEAFPGDVVGLVNPGLFAIGDTVSDGEPLRFDAVPRFAPERFALLRNRDVARYKQFHRGLQQLEEEGAIQVLVTADGAQREVVLAAVGELQFDVVVARLAAEYRAGTTLERLPFEVARWVLADEAALPRMYWPYAGVLRLRDRDGRLIVLFHAERDAAYCAEKNPDVEFRRLG
ncbi:MAG TPA: peptide chain release factor 3 [Candidatus Tectomicrobia bacterium]|nr:peptide chain release factor 3 [Candidatus Tectomicrobia bacterium]